MPKPTRNRDVMLERYGPIVCRMNSSSDPDKIYEIRLLNGSYSCQCRGYAFRKTCKHVVEARSRGIRYEEETVVKQQQYAVQGQNLGKKTALAHIAVRQMLLSANITASQEAINAMARSILPYLSGESDTEVVPVQNPAPVNVRTTRLITLED